MFQLKNYCLLIKDKKTKEPKFGYSPLRKVFEKQTEKQFGAIKSLEISSKKD